MLTHRHNHCLSGHWHRSKGGSTAFPCMGGETKASGDKELSGMAMMNLGTPKSRASPYRTAAQPKSEDHGSDGRQT